MPAVIPIIIALTVASTAVSVKGQIDAGNAARKAGDAALNAGQQAQALENYNADTYDQQAKDALYRGTVDESRLHQQVRALIGSQRAGYAGQNVDVGSGSAVDVAKDAEVLGAEDVKTIRANAAQEAHGFTVQAHNARARGLIDLTNGQYAQQAGEAGQSASKWAAAGTILGTGASLLASRYGFGGTSGKSTAPTHQAYPLAWGAGSY